MLATLALVLSQGVPAPKMTMPEGFVATEWTQFDRYLDRYVFVEVVAEGKTVSAILDSGAGGTVVSESFAEENDLTFGANAIALGVGGPEAIRLVTGLSLTWGPLEISEMTAAAIDLEELSDVFGRPVDFILGREFFKEWVIELDYPGERYRLHAPEGFEMSKGMPTTELYTRGALLQADCSIEGGEVIRGSLDTGSGAFIDVFAKQAESQGLLEDRKLSMHRMGGVGGTVDVPSGTLKKFELCGVSFEGIPASLHREPIKAFNTKLAMANLGGGLFRECVVIFDVPHKRFAMKRTLKEEYLPRDRTGIQFSNAGEALAVRFVAPGSPAEAAGVKEGERILSVNGTLIGDLKPYWGWSRMPSGGEVQLLFESGRELKLVLREYY